MNLPTKLFRALKRIHTWITSLSILFALSGLGQQNDQKLNKGEFQGLLKFGVATSQIYGDDFGGYNKVGLIAGAGVVTRLKPNLKLQLEIDYNNRGSRDPAKPDKGKYNSYKFSLHYIDVPVLLKFWVWKFEFEAGINNGFLVFHNEADQNGPIPQSLYSTAFTRYELAANLGVNVDISEKWYFNVRFHYSALPISSGGLRYINNYGFAGGMFNNSIMFTINRKLLQK